MGAWPMSWTPRLRSSSGVQETKLPSSLHTWTMGSPGVPHQRSAITSIVIADCIIRSINRCRTPSYSPGHPLLKKRPGHVLDLGVSHVEPLRSSSPSPTFLRRGEQISSDLLAKHGLHVIFNAKGYCAA